MGSSPVTINPLTGQPQVLGANGLPLPAMGGASSTTQNPLQAAPPGGNTYAQWLQAPGSETQTGNTGATQLGPSILPQINNNVSPNQTNPLQPFYMSTPNGTATQFQGAQLGQGMDPAVMQMLSPNAAIQALYQQFQPAAAQSTRALDDNLAAMGLVGGPALNAQTNLQQQLDSALGGSISNLISGAQTNQLGAIENQGGLSEQTGIANLNANNQFGIQNLQNQFLANQYNTTAGNDASSATAAAQLAAYNNNLANFQAMNTAGYSGATDIAASGMGGAQNLAGQFATQFPVSSGLGSAFQNLGTGMGGGGSTSGGGAAASSPYTGNPFADAATL